MTMCGLSPHPVYTDHITRIAVTETYEAFNDKRLTESMVPSDLATD